MKVAPTLALGLVDLADMPTRESNPDLQQTTSEPRRWFIRPVVYARDATGAVFSAQRRIYLGDVDTMSEREAQKERARVLALVNDPSAISKRAVLRFSELLETYKKNFLQAGPEHISIATSKKYASLIKQHLEPAFGQMELADITTREVESWLRKKADSGLSWASRADLRYLLGSIFSKAERWGLWEGRNPARGALIGRKRAVRVPRKMTVEQMKRLLESLRPDVALLCKLLLFTTLRISEAMGLRWGSIDVARGLVMVRKRFYRGDLDETKTQKSARDIPLGRLVHLLERPEGARDEDYVFNFPTYVGHDKKPRITRDDRTVRRYFLRPVAEKLGLYYPGFGFHSFRREAITGIAADSDPLVAQLMAGHTKADTTLHYGLVDLPRAEKAIQGFQQRVLGDPQ